MFTTRLLPLLTALGACCFAQTTTIPGSPITLAATNAAGTSFNYTGTLTGATTFTFSSSGQSCLQTSVYCTNGAGVVVVAGAGAGVGQSSTYNATYAGTNNNWTFGSVLMSISGVGAVQIFPANVTNGQGSGAPPTSLSVSGVTLSSLGFGAFSATNPTITIFPADTNYGDNTGSFTVSGSFTNGGGTSVPALSDMGTLMLALLLLAAAAAMMWRRTA